MKKFLKKIAYGIAWLTSLLFNNVVLQCGRKFICLVNTANFRRKLAKRGKNTHIGRHNCFEHLGNVSVGNNFSSGDGLWVGTYPKWGDMTYRPKIVFGDNVSCSRNCHFGAIDEIVIGNNVLFGSNVLVNDHSHGYSAVSDVPRMRQPLVSKGGIEIGDNTWICDNVSILSDVHIGKNCIVGAGSIVTKSFEEDGLLIAGVPARVVKKLDEATQDLLVNSEL